VSKFLPLLKEAYIEIVWAPIQDGSDVLQSISVYLILDVGSPLSIGVRKHA
jgi:hypothetical protein